MHNSSPRLCRLQPGYSGAVAGLAEGRLSGAHTEHVSIYGESLLG